MFLLDPNVTPSIINISLNNTESNYYVFIDKNYIVNNINAWQLTLIEIITMLNKDFTYD
jgi:hypothetical protein